MNAAAAEPYRYRPTLALPYWDEIGGFIEDAVTDASAITGREPHILFPATTAFVLWAWQARGTPLERTRIFRASVVEEFVHLGVGRYLRGSRATHRATLTLMVRALNPADSLTKQRPIPRSVPTQPYSAAEIAALHSWALGQNTSRRRYDALTLLALGLGAGPATREILELRVSSLDIRGDQPVVIVWESRPRAVGRDRRTSPAQLTA
ncbi:hypothetical protein [Microterricola viridarii]|uniref:Tyr recombinase domain-containing protein n=1 Tax=Microterricola viridarii TaxID=412690 RepID=A0A0Y0N694_9MICO|nr:hypothetical protein [Microterricola viridarii]AMB58018.1 hypothetical protein AWU67_03085 [Microterricola viridarii]